MKKKLYLAISLLNLTACSALSVDHNSIDPYEKINRNTYKFNKALDSTLIKPIAKVYNAILPPIIKTSITNFFNNLQMMPTIANDALQGNAKIAYLDTWRLIINSSVGIGGLFDVATLWGLPYKPNDLGITLAKWGGEKSPYFVIPVFGPSTFRDAASLPIDYGVFSVYGYMSRTAQVYSLFGVNMLEIRADLLDNEAFLDEALDEYIMVRDAYLQNRQYKISGKKVEDSDADYIDGESDYIGDDSGSLYVDDDQDGEEKETKQEQTAKKTNKAPSNAITLTSEDGQDEKEFSTPKEDNQPNNINN